MEVDIFVAGIALLIVTLGFVLLYIQRVNISRKLDLMKLEAEAHHQASYGMAKHLRYLQRQNEAFQVEGLSSQARQDSNNATRDAANRYADDSDLDDSYPDDSYSDDRRDSDNPAMTADIVDFSSVYGRSTENDSHAMASDDGVLDSAVERLFSEGADARKLSEALGVSRSEAEIIAHIGPKNRSGHRA